MLTGAALLQEHRIADLPAVLSAATNCTLDVRDFRSVDHRLRLYLDMEVFEENVEEFQCFLKVRASHRPGGQAPAGAG